MTNQSIGKISHRYVPFRFCLNSRCGNRSALCELSEMRKLCTSIMQATPTQDARQKVQTLLRAANGSGWRKPETKPHFGQQQGTYGVLPCRGHRGVLN